MEPQTAWPICLPNDEDEPPEKGERCEVVGWGLKNENGNGSKGVVPRNLQGKIVKIQGVKKDGAIIYENFLCSGDSGAPLSCARERKGHERHIQFGTHSIHTGECGGTSKGTSESSSLKNNVKWISQVTGIIP